MLDSIHHESGITELCMARPPVNALNQELLSALRQAVEKAPAAGTRALVLSGAPGMFSAGVDLLSLLQRDAEGIAADWREFFAVCSAFARSPIPMAAAITGHSPAGGAVLSLFCDYRVMSDGPYRIGLNEVQVGIAVPEAVQFALRRVVGNYRAERLLVAGLMLEAKDARACGFVDELVPQEQVVARSIAWLQELLALPNHAMLVTRQLARADLLSVWGDAARMNERTMVEEFLHADTQAALHTFVAKLKKRDVRDTTDNIKYQEK